MISSMVLQFNSADYRNFQKKKNKLKSITYGNNIYQALCFQKQCTSHVSQSAFDIYINFMEKWYFCAGFHMLLAHLGTTCQKQIGCTIDMFATIKNI